MSSAERRAAWRMREDVRSEMDRAKARREIVDEVVAAAGAYTLAREKSENDEFLRFTREEREARDVLAEAVAKLRLHDIGVEV